MKSKKVTELIDHNIAMNRLSFTVADIEYCVNIAEREAEENSLADREKFRESVQAYETQIAEYAKEIKDIKDKWENDLTMWRGLADNKLIYSKDERQKALYYAEAISAMKTDLDKLIENLNNSDNEKDHV